MCTNGANGVQLGLLIDVVDDYTSLSYRWAHKIAHQAEGGGFDVASVKLHEAQRLLADVRALLDEAREALEESHGHGHGHFTAKLA